MPTILTRVPRYSEWNPGELAGPYDGLTLREWEVTIATCALPEAYQKLLTEPLLEDATPACMGRECWPLSRRALPFTNQELQQATPDTLQKQLLEGLVALWQVLDLEPGIIPGMLRGLLLVGLSVRLRQTLAAFEGAACTAGILPALGGDGSEALSARRELEQALSKLDVPFEPAPKPPTPLREPPRRKRWWQRRAA